METGDRAAGSSNKQERGTLAARPVGTISKFGQHRHSRRTHNPESPTARPTIVPIFRKVERYHAARATPARTGSTAAVTKPYPTSIEGKLHASKNQVRRQVGKRRHPSAGNNSEIRNTSNDRHITDAPRTLTQVDAHKNRQ